MADDESMNPLGWDFWLGQLLTLGAAAFSVWLATRAGFTEAARFTQHQEFRAARNVLRLVRSDLEFSLGELRASRESIKTDKFVEPELRLENLRLATQRSPGGVIDPRLFAEILLLFEPEVREYLDTIPKGSLREKIQREEFGKLLDRVFDHADRTVMPKLSQQEHALDAAEARLR